MIEHTLVFLTYNRPALIDQRLNEVSQYIGHRDDFEVVVFDNGSTDYGVRLVLVSRAQRGDFPLRVVRQDKNLGFSKGFNKAVNHAEGSKIYLLSDDVTIFGDVIESLRKLNWEKTVFGHRMIVAGSGWNDFPEKSILYLDGYFFAMLRSTWDQLGGFDKTYSPYDYEDVDFSHTAREEGYKLCEVKTLSIRHAAASTIGYGDERFEHTVKMRALFAEKWGLTNEPERP
ncbi:MAG: glycosyltransferase [Thermoplasmata archaeon]|nr:glycosyltransferase [Thermoplasmata archaeon]